MSAQINDTFFETLTGTALEIATQLASQMDKPAAKNQLTQFTGNVKEFGHAHRKCGHAQIVRLADPKRAESAVQLGQSGWSRRWMAVRRAPARRSSRPEAAWMT